MRWRDVNEWKEWLQKKPVTVVLYQTLYFLVLWPDFWGERGKERLESSRVGEEMSSKQKLLPISYLIEFALASTFLFPSLTTDSSLTNDSLGNHETFSTLLPLDCLDLSPHHWVPGEGNMARGDAGAEVWQQQFLIWKGVHNSWVPDVIGKTVDRIFTHSVNRLSFVHQTPVQRKLYAAWGKAFPNCSRFESIDDWKCIILLVLLRLVVLGRKVHCFEGLRKMDGRRKMSWWIVKNWGSNQIKRGKEIFLDRKKEGLQEIYI